MSHEDEREPFGKRLLDNIWLLFLLSLLISGILYNAWGIIDLMSIRPIP